MKVIWGQLWALEHSWGQSMDAAILYMLRQTLDQPTANQRGRADTRLFLNVWNCKSFINYNQQDVNKYTPCTVRASAYIFRSKLFGEPGYEYVCLGCKNHWLPGFLRLYRKCSFSVGLIFHPRESLFGHGACFTEFSRMFPALLPQLSLTTCRYLQKGSPEKLQV